MVVRNQYDATRWNDLHQRFANQLGIGIGETVARDLPHLGVGAAQAVADRVEFGTRAGDNRRRSRCGIDLLCRGQQFGGGIVSDATLVRDVGKNPGRHCIPPLAFISSMSLSAISSLLPCRISAPLPKRRHKVVVTLHLCGRFSDGAFVDAEIGCAVGGNFQ